jgi:asparagine synthetase B (glutamine-hydrolysing)
MCGIVGAGHWADAPAFETAANLQMHHGPDDGGVWEYCAADGTHVG